MSNSVAGGPVEEAQMLLDDHVVKSQAMAASPFSKPFEERLVPWERKLRRFQVLVFPYTVVCAFAG
jgi:dynein heavy chain